MRPGRLPEDHPDERAARAALHNPPRHSDEQLPVNAVPEPTTPEPTNRLHQPEPERRRRLRHRWT